MSGQQRIACFVFTNDDNNNGNNNKFKQNERTKNIQVLKSGFGNREAH